MYNFRFRIIFSALLLLAPSAFAQQGKGLFFSSFGSDAPISYGRFSDIQAFYFDIPETETRPVYLRIFDIEVGGRYDEKHGNFDTKTRFVILGGNSANTIIGGKTSIGRENLSYSPDDVLYERTFGQDRQVDGKWFNLRQLDLDLGYNTGTGFVRYILLVQSLDGDDSNFFDLALSYSKTAKVPVPNAKSYVYSLSLKIPSLTMYGWDSYEGQIKIPTEMNTSINIATFDMDDVPMNLTVPYQGSRKLLTSGDGVWISNNIPIRNPAPDREIAFNFFGRDFNNTFGLLVTNQDNVPLPIFLPILDYEPPKYSEPSVSYAFSHIPSDCSSVQFSVDPKRLGDLKEPDITWEFNDFSLKGPDISHTFDSLGFHVFTLKVEGLLGSEKRTFLFTDSVLINQPPTAWAGGNRVSAPGSYLVFDGTVSEDFDGKIKQYLWDFGDGKTAKYARYDHIYTEPGSYTVKLVVTDDSNTPCNTAFSEINVKVNAAPVAQIVGPKQVQIGEVFQLDGSSSYDPDGRIVDYIWQIGDSTLQGAVVKYALIDKFRVPVTLEVTDDAEATNSIASASWTIRVNQPPVAVAGPDKKVSPNRPSTFNANQSYDPDGSINEYYWDFGDGNTASGAVVQHTYEKTGNFTATLRVVDDSERADATDAINVFVNAPPVPVIEGQNVLADGRVSLSAKKSFDSDGQITSYQWDLGDGRVLLGDEIRFSYQKPGKYKVTLTVADDARTFSSTQSIEQEIVINSPPVAVVKGSKRTAVGEEVVFEGFDSFDSDGGISRYDWDLGDGTVATGVSTQHRYASPGVYQVQLTVYDDSSLPNAFSQSYHEVVVNAAPELVFDSPERVTEGQKFTIDLGKSFDPEGKSISYYWFERGKWEKGVARRNFTAKKGLETIKVAIDDGENVGNSRVVKEIIIPFNQSPVVVIEPKFTRTSERTITFRGSGSYDPDGDRLRYYWEFGDGQTSQGPIAVHTFKYGGEYTIRLTVDDQKGLANSTSFDTVSVFINRSPQPYFEIPPSICLNEPFEFNGESSVDPDGKTLSYEWDFGDGNMSTTKKGKHSFSREGSYQVILIVDDGESLSNSSSTYSQTIFVIGNPVADAGFDQIICTTEIVKFNASKTRGANEEFNEFTWDFGDGNTGFGMQTNHMYESPGEYSVVLTVGGVERENSCSGISVDTVLIKVIPEPKAVLTLGSIVPINEPLVLDINPSVTPYHELESFVWTISDTVQIRWEKQIEILSDGTEQNVWVENGPGPKDARAVRVEPGEQLPLSMIALEEGEYEVRLDLRVDSESSCNSASGYQFISVMPKPKLEMSDIPVLVPGEDFPFTASEVAGRINRLTDLLWDFGDGTTSRSPIASHAYENPGVYTVTLKAVFGMSTTISSVQSEQKVVVNAPPIASFTSPAVAFPEYEITFDASDSKDPDGEIDTYQWYFSDGTRKSGKIVTHKFPSVGAYSVALTVDDGSRLSNARNSLTKQIRIDDTPSINWRSKTNYCPDELVNIVQAFDLKDSDSTSVSIKIGGKELSWAQAKSQRFSFPGNYQIGVKMEQEILPGLTIPESVQSITVNGAPEIYADVPSKIVIGPANTFAEFVADKTFDPNGDRMNFYWDLGDGTSKVGKSVRHQYLRPGTYTVSLRVADIRASNCSETRRTFKVVVEKE